MGIAFPSGNSHFGHVSETTRLILLQNLGAKRTAQAISSLGDSFRSCRGVSNHKMPPPLTQSERLNLHSDFYKGFGG